jgi:hypothetical protein
LLLNLIHIIGQIATFTIIEIQIAVLSKGSRARGRDFLFPEFVEKCYDHVNGKAKFVTHKFL